MEYGHSGLGSSTWGARDHFTVLPAYVAPDTIVRASSFSPSIKVEVAWGNDLTQTVDINGAAIASVIASGYSDSGYPASNLISGSNVHYNPLTDLDNNWWGYTYSGANYATVDLGSSLAFNNLIVYLHPLSPTCSAFHIQGSNDNSTFTDIVSWSGSDLKVDLAVSGTWRYIKLIPDNVGIDNVVRIVSFQVFNWIDETSNVKLNSDNSPMITIENNEDTSQSSLGTKSECDITMVNTTNRFTPTNSSSPIFGVLQPDGRGSGMRPQTPVRVTGGGTGNGGTFSQYIYRGWLQNDDSSAGTQAITVDQQAHTALMICKGLTDKLSVNVDTPVYEGASFDYILRDICYRCGIADQDLNIQNMGQGVPWLSFGSQSAQSIIDQMIEAQPFMRENESYSPQGKLNFVNHGRSRYDIDFSIIYPGKDALGSFISQMISFPSQKIMYIFATDNQGSGRQTHVYKWDTTKSIGTGITSLGTNIFSNGYSSCKYVVFGSIIYAFNSDNLGSIYYWDTKFSFSGFSLLTQLGSSDGIFTSICSSGNFVFISTGPNVNLYVWDMTKNISTKVLLATTATYSSGDNLISDGTYLFICGSSRALTWNYAGDPYNNAFSATTRTYPSLTASANPAISIDTNHKIYLFTSSITNPTMFTLSEPSGTFSSIGNIPISGSSGAYVFSSILHNTYIYFQFYNRNQNISTLFVWDISKSFSYLFNLGTMLGVCPLSTFDYLGRIWNYYQFAFNAILNTPQMQGFLVEGTNYLTSGQYSFNPSDGFTKNMVLSDGNPLANRIQISSDFFQLQNLSDVLDLSQSNEYNNSSLVISNQSNTFSLPVSDSYRGYNGLTNGTATARYCVISPNTQAITGNSTDTIDVADTTGIINGVSKILLLGGTPEIKTVSSNVPNTSITFNSLLNGTTHTSAVWSNGPTTGGILYDSPGTIQTLTISGVAYPAQFWGFSDICYLVVDATGLAGTAITSLSIYSSTLSQVQTNQVLVDKSDTISQKLYHNQFVKVIQSPMFNDLSFYQDLLLDGKYAKLYLQELDTPWYPPVNNGDIISITNSDFGVSSSLFEVVGYKHNGYTTTFTSKGVLSVYNI